MLFFELSQNSAKPGDHVFVIVPKQKISTNGRRITSRSKNDLEVIEAVIDQIHYGWSHLTSAYSWSCSLAEVVGGENPLCGRYIQDVPVEDCFLTKEQAIKELDKRKELAA